MQRDEPNCTVPSPSRHQITFQFSQLNRIPAATIYNRKNSTPHYRQPCNDDVPPKPVIERHCTRTASKERTQTLERTLRAGEGKSCH
jgi:hypothetical protein